MKKVVLLMVSLLTACVHGGAGSSSGGGGGGGGVCKKTPTVSLGVPVPTAGSFVGVSAEAKVVYHEDVGCQENAERVLAQVKKLIGAPANRQHRVDGAIEMTYYLWENATTSLGLLISHQGKQWQVTLGFSPVARKV